VRPTTPQPAQVPPAPKPVVYDQPQLPPPPPLNMKFFGLGTLSPNGPRRAFLQDGEEVHIVSEGDILRNRIRINHIGNDRLEFEDVNTGAKNSAALDMPPPA
jgi:Tfp pilus assembly protein PilP